MIASGRSDSDHGHSTCERRSGVLYCDALFGEEVGLANVLGVITEELVYTAAFARRYLELQGIAGVSGGCDGHSNRGPFATGWSGNGCGEIREQIQKVTEAEREAIRDFRKAIEVPVRKP